ncbi:MAG: hypothetical protein IK092_01480, partial [Muribaculaceae bacterium]|nr:hypothetical protein [Muribaculaceae bacterium]
SDKQYVISHDETTNRVGGNLTVANATLEQLKAENYTQTRGGVTYTGKICTVSEYLDICVEKNVFPVIELKWTTGINNNDMSNFPGLAELIANHGLNDKAIILTSMKSSLEYVRKNYPYLKCQWLCNANWEGNENWCREWDFNPSISVGNFDQYTVKKFRQLGLFTACWTVDTKASYESIGKMGVYMMTCNSLMPSDMPELEDIDWGEVDDILDPIELKCDTVFLFSRFGGGLPQDFPSGVAAESAFNSGEQAAIKDGVFYINNYTTGDLLTFDKTGRINNNYEGTNSPGIAFDDAGNLILRNDSITPTPSKLKIYPAGSTQPLLLDFELLNPGQTNYISASGDVMSEEGGYVYFFPNGQKLINILKIANGEVVEVTASGNLTIAGTAAGVVFPIENNPQKFIYQVRNNGFYYYYKEDNGLYITGRASTQAPARNNSLGGCYFKLDGHKLFLHSSGSNFKGGFSVKDMNAKCTAVLTIPTIGDGGSNVNPSMGSWFKAEPIDDQHIIIYEYCMGNGYAAYQLYVGEPWKPQLRGDLDGNGEIDVIDVTMLINYILDPTTEGVIVENADVNNDNEIDVRDVTAIIAIILG